MSKSILYYMKVNGSDAVIAVNDGRSRIMYSLKFPDGWYQLGTPEERLNAVKSVSDNCWYDVACHPSTFRGTDIKAKIVKDISW